MISESQERMVAVVEPERLAEVEALCARWELACTAIGEVTESGRAALLLRRRARRRDPGAVPHGRGAALSARDRGSRAGRAGRGRARAGRAVPAPRAARRAEHPQPPARVRALRPARRIAHGSPSWTGRGGAPPASVDARARGVARRPRPRRLARSAHGGHERGARVGAKRRLRRGHAARDHELPELRQSREAGGRLGAHRGDRGDGPCLRSARHSRGLGERVALQRDRRARHRPHPGRRLCRYGRGRADDSVAMAGGGRRAARRGRTGRGRRLRVPGALPGRRSRVSAAARPRARDGADLIPRRRGPDPHERARRLRRRPRGRGRRAGDLVRGRRRDRARKRHGHLVRRGRRPRGRHLPARGRRAARRRAAAADRRGRRRLDPRARLDELAAAHEHGTAA